MARIPITDGQSIAPTPQSAPSTPVLRSPNLEVARAVSGAIDTVGGIAAGAAAHVEKAYNEAADLQANEALLKYAVGNDARLTDFQKLRGADADARAADAFKSADDARQEIAAGLGSKRARDTFLGSSAGEVLRFHRGVNNHALQEFETRREVALKSAETLAVQRAAGGQVSGDEYQDFLAKKTEAERQIDALSRSPEEAQARKNELGSKVAAAWISGLVSQGKVREAQQLLPLTRKELGTRYDEVAKQVDHAVTGAEKDERRAHAFAVVDYAAEEAAKKALDSSGYGYLNEEQLRAAVDEYRASRPVADDVSPLSVETDALLGRGVGPDESTAEYADALDTAIRKRVREEKARLRSHVDVSRNVLEKNFADGAEFDAGTVAFEEKFDGRYLNGLLKRKKAKERGVGGRGQKAADAAQKNYDYIAKNLARAALYDGYVGSASEWIREHDGSTEGDLVVSEKAASDIERYFAQDGAADARGQVREEKADARELRQAREAAARDFKSMWKTSETKTPEYQARLGYFLNEYDARANGKPLDKTGLSSLLAEAKTKTGGFLGFGGKMNVDTWASNPPAPKPAAPPRKFTAQEQQALEWARANASDPRAAAILKKLGVQ